MRLDPSTLSDYSRGCDTTVRHREAEGCRHDIDALYDAAVMVWSQMMNSISLYDTLYSFHV
jgi:hypothetical protein